jgi:erythromycin esterase-like protein
MVRLRRAGRPEAPAPPALGELVQTRGHRAIGVVYHPEFEHLGNFVPTILPRRYDAFVYLDQTQALHPLAVPVREEGEVPETCPAGV